jgi:two-component system, OmpR family, sensor kinase
MTLRARLLLVLIGIVTAGLLVSSLVTYKSLESFLVTRLDQQLTNSPNQAADSLIGCLSQPPGKCQTQNPPAVPPGTFGELRINGVTLVSGWFLLSSSSQPKFASNLSVSTVQNPNIFSVTSSNGTTYHAMATTFQRPFFSGVGVVVVAVPLTQVDQTLGHLIWIEILVGVSSLVVLGAISWWIVRRGLRPLDEMATTAAAIAAGDLTQRVPGGDPGTEVGRLGEALNVMLEGIEESFAVRKASEERLRRFLADASHELRTPLTSIRGYAEMFDRGARDRPEDLEMSMRYIRADADRMSALVDDLLLIARLGRERPLAHEVVELREIIEPAVAAVTLQDPDRRISLSAPESATTVGDADRLRQVVDNLLVNALRHTPAGTPIEVALRNDGDSALITVEDHGFGIPESERKSIFEPFNRMERSRSRATGGEGLGLAIVATIVQAHGGTLGVGEVEGGGARFWVRFQLAKQEPVQTVPVVEPVAKHSEPASLLPTARNDAPAARH